MTSCRLEFKKIYDYNPSTGCQSRVFTQQSRATLIFRLRRFQSLKRIFL